MFSQYFKKLKFLHKSPTVTFYESYNISSQQQVFIKKLKIHCSWDRLLKNTNLILSQKIDGFAKVIEIMRFQKKYYIICEMIQGPSLFQYLNTAHKKMKLTQFYTIFNQVCKIANNILQINSQAYVTAQWIFLHQKKLKIVHFQPFLRQQNEQMKKKKSHYQQIRNPEQNQLLQSEITNTYFQRRQQNMNFNLGIIAYYLLTGINMPLKHTYSELKDLHIHGQENLIEITKNQSLSKVIMKMIKFDEQKISFMKNIKQLQLLRQNNIQGQTNMPKKIEHYYKPKRNKQKANRYGHRKIKRDCCCQKYQLTQKRSLNKKSFRINHFAFDIAKHRKSIQTQHSLPKVINHYHRIKTMLQTHSCRPIMFKDCNLMKNM